MIFKTSQNPRIILKDEQEYPPMLREIYNPPQKLYIKGKIIESDFKKSVAIVGTRKCSDYGKRAAIYFASGLAKEGVTIISGLALGIDSFSHTAALEAGGRTIAVLGTGINVIYPSSNKGLAKRIEEQGAIISEFEPDEIGFPSNFPQRNRIVAGLSYGVIIIEAPEKSGALITARLAVEHGRDVFCVPGEIFSPYSKGVNALIQEGAMPVTDYKQVLEELNFEYQKEENKVQLTFESKEESSIYTLLQGSATPLHIDEMIKATKLSAKEINIHLSLMEMKGLIKHFGQGRYIIF